jgi:hypothetical protein
MIARYVGAIALAAAALAALPSLASGPEATVVGQRIAVAEKGSRPSPAAALPLTAASQQAACQVPTQPPTILLGGPPPPPPQCTGAECGCNEEEDCWPLCGDPPDQSCINQCIIKEIHCEQCCCCQGYECPPWC